MQIARPRLPRLGAALVCAGMMYCCVLPAAAEPPPPSTVDAHDRREVSLSFGFEPRLGNYQALDDELTAYGFAPVGAPALLTWGLRGRAFFGSGLFMTMTMSYAFGMNEDASTPAPTTTSLIDAGAGVGYRLPVNLFASLNAGFSVLTHSVGSQLEGGALVYMGPSLHPRLGYIFSGGKPFGSFLAASVGYALHLPLGVAHRIPLWEEPFERRAVHALTLGIESGLDFYPGRSK